MGDGGGGDGGGKDDGGGGDGGGKGGGEGGGGMLSGEVTEIDDKMKELMEVKNKVEVGCGEGR